MAIKQKKIFTFLRRKGETSVITTPYTKFLNILMRKVIKINI